MAQANPLHDYLDASLISVKSNIGSRKKLLQHMAEMLSSALPPSSEDNIEKEVYHAILEREKLGNTGIGNGIAIPHTRLARAESAIIAIIILDEAIDYDSVDRQNVDVAFGLVVPQNASQEHLQLLANIARLMSQDGFREKLLTSNTAEQAIDFIHQWSSSGD
jgi:PTS system nitrogen regulatory IIA component